MYTSSGIISVVSLFAFWTASPLPAPVVIIGLFGYGFGSGAWITLVAASCGAISPVREFGMRLGMLWTLSSFGMLAGPVICGGECLLVLHNIGTDGYSFDQLERPEIRIRCNFLRSHHSDRRNRLHRTGHLGIHRGPGVEASTRARNRTREGY